MFKGKEEMVVKMENAFQIKHDPEQNLTTEDRLVILLHESLMRMYLIEQSLNQCVAFINALGEQRKAQSHGIIRPS